MKRFRRSAAVAMATALGAGGLLAATAAPAWAPTCGSACGMYPKPPNPPASAEQCKDDGWRLYTDVAGFAFANQGACVSDVASGGHSNRALAPSSQIPTNPAESSGSRRHRQGRRDSLRTLREIRPGFEIACPACWRSTSSRRYGCV